MDIKNFSKNLPDIEDFIIKIDKTGELCTLLSLYVRGVNLKKLEAAIIQKDESGDLHYFFIDNLNQNKGR